MRRLLLLAPSLLLCISLAGCGDGEIPPTTEKTESLSPEATKAAMQESMNHMPPEQRKRMEQYMKNMPSTQSTPSTTGGAGR